MRQTIRFKRNEESTPAVTPPPIHLESQFALKQFLEFARKDKRRAYGFALLGLICSIVLGARWYWIAMFHVSTDNAYVEGELFPVNSRIMGFVKSVKVSENQKIKKGDLLAELDDSDLKIEIEYKEAKFKKASQDFQRAQRLVSSQAMSKSDFELSETNFTAAKADLDGSRLKQSFTQILAQADGIIAKQNIHSGQFVQPGQSLFVMVGASDQNWVKANFKETQIEKLRPGMRSTIQLDAFPHQQWEGEVVEIYPSSGSVLSLLPPENATGNFTKIVQRIPVKIKVKEVTQQEFRAGVSAHVTVHLR